jgi:hypothetical protein
MIDSMESLVAILKRFHRSWLDDPALDPSLIPADLPYGLAIIYRELGALVEREPARGESRLPFANQDALVPLSNLRRIDGMVEFAWENQSNWSCRCPLQTADPKRWDPAVYSNAPDPWEESRKGFVIVCPSLNHFLTTLSLQEAVFSCRNLVALPTGGEPRHILAGEWLPLWRRGRYVYPGPSHDFFISPDQETLVMCEAGVWIGSPVRPVRELVRPGVGCRVLHGG